MPPTNVPTRAERDEEMKGLLGQLRALPELYASQEAQNGAPISATWTQTHERWWTVVLSIRQAHIGQITWENRDWAGFVRGQVEPSGLDVLLRVVFKATIKEIRDAGGDLGRRFTAVMRSLAATSEADLIFDLGPAVCKSVAALKLLNALAKSTTPRFSRDDILGAVRAAMYERHGDTAFAPVATYADVKAANHALQEQPDLAAANKEGPALEEGQNEQGDTTAPGANNNNNNNKRSAPPSPPSRRLRRRTTAAEESSILEHSRAVSARLSGPSSLLVDLRGEEMNEVEVDDDEDPAAVAAAAESKNRLEIWAGLLAEIVAAPPLVPSEDGSLLAGAVAPLAMQARHALAMLGARAKAQDYEEVAAAEDEEEE